MLQNINVTNYMASFTWYMFWQTTTHEDFIDVTREINSDTTAFNDGNMVIREHNFGKTISNNCA